jgi:hypothetical protein
MANSYPSKCEVKSLYNHSSDKSELWTEFKNPINEERHRKAQARPSAVVHRFSKKPSTEGGTLDWETQSIEIQSQQLKTSLADIFKDYPDWNPGPIPYIFLPPFQQFFHRRERILEESSDKQTDISKRMEVALLREALKSALAPHDSELQQIKETKAISFKSLWLIFPPGNLVVTHETGNLCVSKLRALKFIEKSGYSLENTPRWRLDLRRTDWNGSYCGSANTVVFISEFSGSQPVTALDAYPFEFFPDQKEAPEQLLTRGQKFADLRGFHVKTCIGKKYVLEKRMFDSEEIVKPVFPSSFMIQHFSQSDYLH